MKLPRSLVLFLRPKNDFPPVFLLYVLSDFLEVTPAKQSKAVARKRHAMAAHMKPKAYLPSEAVCWFPMKLFRPITYAALLRVSTVDSFRLSVGVNDLRHQASGEGLEE